MAFACTFIFISHAIPAHAKTFVGQWTTVDGDCNNNDDVYRIKIKTGSIDYYESFCTFLSGQDSGTTRVIKAKCSGEGEDWTSVIRITPSGEDIILSDERYKAVYHRCPGLPPNNSDEIIQAKNAVQTHATSPSFNCSQANKPDEIAICGNETLASNDVMMNDEYIGMKERIGKGEGNRLAKQYLRRRRSCGGDVGCINQIQTEAIAAYRSQGREESNSYSNTNTGSLETDNSIERSSSSRAFLDTSFEAISNLQKASGYDPFVFYLGCGLFLLGSVSYLIYRWTNTESCPSCGATNWHSNAEQSDLLDRKMRMGTYDRTTYYDGYTQHNPTNYLYYDEVYRFHMKCKNCGHRWQVIRKKRG